MRLTLILLAFVSSVFFHTDPAAARPKADSTAQARKQPKVQKRRAARSAAKPKPSSKGGKASRTAKVRTDEAANQGEAEQVAAAPKVEAPLVKRAPVAQATDDEVPSNEPKKRR